MSAGCVIDLGAWLRRHGRVRASPQGGADGQRVGPAGCRPRGESAAGPDQAHWLVMNLHRAALLRDWYAASGEVGKWRAMSDRIAEALQCGVSYVCVEPGLDTGDAVAFAEMLKNGTDLYQRQVAADFD